MTRVNERIRAPKVRVVYEDQQLGVMSSRVAVEKAKSVGLDLVEVAANANPPVCRVCDYGKYKYEQAKLKKKAPKVANRIKEIKLRVGTDTHDYNIKLARAEQFLDQGNKVRVRLQFRGRENAHREIGFEVLTKVGEDLKQIANVDQAPRLAGRAVTMMLSPLPKEQRKRHFYLSHGNLVDPDDEGDEDIEFDDDDELGDDVQADANEGDKAGE
ncbi:translation initiation factor IF-3 [Verrucomicrobiaceae bacterium R5-34]|uniref:Translation initiation factor IF-3 n=1 Tax=Oceaniferula flava TaxID=2800421 RepID=A0AAE2VBV4_9BACT|nr:translation initiation factor IF-3 [Oceaniferula flavus]MBK1831454.1 translation initiation factor IF-3 [Verrucomicrobiaceae bacterium R5-34]MBK1854306.1 translation initiation factor IF-3 [Oceaniferula flavus]MBM1135612.1 translation initiation factor IF-3 [Oceaniferula flavus]